MAKACPVSRARATFFSPCGTLPLQPWARSPLPPTWGDTRAARDNVATSGATLSHGTSPTLFQHEERRDAQFKRQCRDSGGDTVAPGRSDMDTNDLLSHIRSGEGLVTEFKRRDGKPERDVCETICSFADCWGGNVSSSRTARRPASSGEKSSSCKTHASLDALGKTPSSRIGRQHLFSPAWPTWPRT